jgi:hypothetical protein
MLKRWIGMGSAITFTAILPATSLAQGIDSFSDSALRRDGDFYSNLFHQKFLNNLVDPIKSRRTNRRTETPKPAKTPITQASTITIPQQNGATMPKKLAQSAPQEKRQKVEQVFSQLLASYPKLEQQFNIPESH